MGAAHWRKGKALADYLAVCDGDARSADRGDSDTHRPSVRCAVLSRGGADDHTCLCSRTAANFSLSQRFLDPEYGNGRGRRRLGVCPWQCSPCSRRTACLRQCSPAPCNTDTLCPRQCSQAWCSPRTACPRQCSQARCSRRTARPRQRKPRDCSPPTVCPRQCRSAPYSRFYPERQPPRDSGEFILSLLPALCRQKSVAITRSLFCVASEFSLFTASIYSGHGRHDQCYVLHPQRRWSPANAQAPPVLASINIVF